ncbi:MAG: DnaA regulatory inactivator Hda [Thiohalocapsa sp.]
MHQLALPLMLPAAGGFESFVAAGNEEAVVALQQWAEGRGSRYVLVHGPADSGKSHLLLAACHDVVERGGTALYLPLDQDGPAPAILEDLETRDAVVVDALEAVSGDATWERGLFDLYNRLQDAGKRLLVAARVPPPALRLELPDLRSRLSAGPAYLLRGLDDDGRARLLDVAALQRGLCLDPAAVRYILNRCPRDPGWLLQLLDELDRVCLQRRRAPTARLIGELLADRQT